MRSLGALDRLLDRFSRAGILALAALSVPLVGGVDYATGYEVSTSLFYLGPVALAAWYGGRWPGIFIAALSCVSWYIADTASGNQYSYAAIPVWNALIRLGFFLITSLLLTALKESLVNQRHLARTDALTGLFGRRAFEDRLEHDLALAHRRPGAITLAYLDLDDFKAVNDTLGHAEGDRVLQTTGRVLKRSVRQSDTAARLGGDEFALVLPDTDRHGAKQAITEIAQELRKAFATTDSQVSCSIGAVTFLNPGLSPAEALAAADALMYEVKRKHKGAVEFREIGEAGPPSAAEDRPLSVNPLQS
jgi:diguanylate cyclase (GGDEF)-like protein